MGKHLVSIFGLCLFTGIFTDLSAAQPAATDSLPPAKHALQFQLDQNFSISSFEGSVFSLRQFRSGAPDRRWAVSVSGSITKSDGETEHSVQTNSTTDESTDTMNEINIRLIRQRLHSLYQRGPVTAYTAFGWTIPFGYTYRPSTNYRANSLRTKTNLTKWNIGLGGQLNF